MTVIGVLGGVVLVLAYVHAWLFVVGLAIEEERPYDAAVVAVGLLAPLILAVAFIADSSNYCDPITKASIQPLGGEQ